MLRDPMRRGPVFSDRCRADIDFKLPKLDVVQLLQPSYGLSHLIQDRRLGKKWRSVK